MLIKYLPHGGVISKGKMGEAIGEIQGEPKSLLFVCAHKEFLKLI